MMLIGTLKKKSGFIRKRSQALKMDTKCALHIYYIAENKALLKTHTGLVKP